MIMKAVGLASKPHSESQFKFQNIIYKKYIIRLMNPVWEKNKHKEII